MPCAALAADLWISEYLSPCDVWQHGVTRVLAHRRTPFQDMYVVESGPYGKLRSLMANGRRARAMSSCTTNRSPMPRAPYGKPERVLIAGGADGGVLREVLKWKSVREAVVADIDGDVIDACRELLPEIHQRIRKPMGPRSKSAMPGA